MRPVSGTSFLYSERTLEEQLAEGEHVLVRAKRHPMSLWKPVGRALLAILAWLWYAFEVPNPGKVLDLLSVVVLALVAWVGWREWERRHNRFIITDQRLLLYEGIITRTIPMMRLSKVTDVTYYRSVPGRVLGYGTIIIESAGQDQAMHDLTYLPEPDSVYAELNGALFGRKAKEKAPNGKRHRLRRGRRDRGDGGAGPGPTGGPGRPGGPGGRGGPEDPGSGGRSGGGGSRGPVQPGDTGGWSDSTGPIRDGDSGGFFPFGDAPAYDGIDQADVPPAGHRTRPAGRDRRRGVDDATIYRSADRPGHGIGEEDTGPIPIVQRPRPGPGAGPRRRGPS